MFILRDPESSHDGIRGGWWSQSLRYQTVGARVYGSLLILVSALSTLLELDGLIGQGK